MAHIKADKIAEWILEQDLLKLRLIRSDSFPWVVPKKLGYGVQRILEGGESQSNNSNTDDRPGFLQNLTKPTSKPGDSQNLAGSSMIEDSQNLIGSKSDNDDPLNHHTLDFTGSKSKIVARSKSDEDAKDHNLAGSKIEDDKLEELQNLARLEMEHTLNMACSRSDERKIIAESKNEDDKLKDMQNFAGSRSDEAKIEELRYIGGMDLSFVKEDETLACSALVVIDARTMETVYEDLELVALDMPYIPGFLAFRESPALLDLLVRMRSSRPDLFPQLLMIDGNGVLHPREFGLASHLGVVVDVPTLGIAKTLFEVDGLDERSVKREARKSLPRAGDAMDLVGRSGKIWGSALRSTQECVNPVFVSIGHRISLETGVDIVKQCCKFRVPEPVRRADKLSRDYIRQCGVKR